MIGILQQFHQKKEKSMTIRETSIQELFMSLVVLAVYAGRGQ
jgi:hypothetical protein